MEIRKLEIDLDNVVLKINGEKFETEPIVVTLPGPEGWPFAMLFNAEQATGTSGECSELRVECIEPNRRSRNEVDRKSERHN